MIMASSGIVHYHQLLTWHLCFEMAKEEVTIDFTPILSAVDKFYFLWCLME